MLRVLWARLALLFAFDARRRCAILRGLRPAGKAALPLLLRQMKFIGAYMDEVRDTAARVILDMGVGILPVLILRLDREKGLSNREAELLASYGAAAKDALPLLVQRSAHEKLAALLTEIDPAGGATLLAQRLDETRKGFASDPQRATRIMKDKLRTLSELGSLAKSAVPALKRVVEDDTLVPTTIKIGFSLGGGEDPTYTYDLRLEAVRALGEIAPAEEIAFLGGLATGKDEGLASSAIDGLAKANDPAVLPFLLKGLNARTEHVKFSCLRGIEKLGVSASAAEAPLLEIMQSSRKAKKGKRYALFVAQTLDKIHAPRPPVEMAAILVEACLESLEHDRRIQWAVRLDIARSLSKIDRGIVAEHRPALEQMLQREPDADVRGLLTKIIGV